MKRLYRSENDRKIAGDCGGLGEYLNIDSTVIRAAWIVVTVLTAFVPMMIAYIILAFIMPAESEVKGGQKKRQT